MTTLVYGEERLIRVCDTENPYPPFRWFNYDNEGGRKPQGFTLELLRIITREHHWRFELDTMPLTRCLREVAEGSRYQLVLNSSRSPERGEIYYYTDPYWYVHFDAFYLPEQTPSAASIQSRYDLRHFKLCGLSGNNYSAFDLPEGAIDLGAQSYESLFNKLQHGRCEVVPYNREVINGLRLIGADYVQENRIASRPIIDIAPWPLVMLVSRHYADAPTFIGMVNDDIRRMERSGELKKLFDLTLAGDKKVAQIIKP